MDLSKKRTLMKNVQPTIKTSRATHDYAILFIMRILFFAILLSPFLSHAQESAPVQPVGETNATCYEKVSEYAKQIVNEQKLNVVSSTILATPPTEAHTDFMVSIVSAQAMIAKKVRCDNITKVVTDIPADAGQIQ